MPPRKSATTLDETLLTRIRDQFKGDEDVTERRMFGGVVFLFGGHIGVGVHGAEMIVRTSPENAAHVLGQAGVRAFDLGGRVIKGWLLIGNAATARARDLRKWLNMGSGFARTLPSK